MADERIERLLKTWHLQSKPGVLTASLVMLVGLEAILLRMWPGILDFIVSQFGLILIVVLSVALVDAGNIWDGRLFDDLYRPPGSIDDTGRELRAGRFLDQERPWGGLFPSGPVLMIQRKHASTAIDTPVTGLYRACRDYLEASPDRKEHLTATDEPLELSKGLRALLAPLVAVFIVGVVVAAVAWIAKSGNWTTWAAVAVAAVPLWIVFAYVFIQLRYEHMLRLYKAVAQAGNSPPDGP